MRAGAICFHAADGGAAEELGRYLELHTPVRWELAEAQRSEDFLDTLEQCLAAAWPRQL